MLVTFGLYVTNIPGPLSEAIWAGGLLPPSIGLKNMDKPPVLTKISNCLKKEI